MMDDDDLNINLIEELKHLSMNASRRKLEILEKSNESNNKPDRLNQIILSEEIELKRILEKYGIAKPEIYFNSINKLFFYGNDTSEIGRIPQMFLLSLLNSIDHSLPFFENPAVS